MPQPSTLSRLKLMAFLCSNRTIMTSSIAENEENYLRERTDPPQKYRKIIKQPTKLIFDLLYLLFAFWPLLIWSIVESYKKKPKSVADKTVLITGAGRGLGRGLAMKFADLGCRVACVDIDVDLNQETIRLIDEKHPGQAKAYTCNVAKMESIKLLKKAILRDFSEVNILINNAGIVNASPLLEIDEDEAQRFISINFTSHVMMMTEFLPEMIDRNEGHLVSISSSSGFIGLSKACLYSATKHALIGLMESIEFELQEIPHNKIRTSTICPYFINTSPFYMQFWNLRFPPLRISETVAATVDGILKDKRLINIPNRLFYILQIQRMLPDRLNNLLRQTFYCKLEPPSKQFQASLPLYQNLVEALAK